MRHKEAVAQSTYSWAYRETTGKKYTFANDAGVQILLIGDTLRLAKPCQKPEKYDDWEPVMSALLSLYGSKFSVENLETAASGRQVNLEQRDWDNMQWKIAAQAGHHGWAHRVSQHGGDSYVNKDGTRVNHQHEIITRGGWKPERFNDWKAVTDHFLAITIDNKIGRTTVRTQGPTAATQYEVVSPNGRHGLQKLMADYTKHLEDLGQTVEALKDTTLDNPNLREHIASVRDLAETLLGLL